jgi:hypothetical protein
VKGDLPANGPVLAIAEDYQNSGLLFAGTEFGLFVSTNGGQRWIQLKGGLPTIAVRDLAIQKRENDLVLATFGRGFYVLDNYSPLRSLSTETVAKEAYLFAVKDALLYIEAQPLGGRGKSFQGESYFIADNPPFGASLTYYLKETLKTRKEKRQDAERDAEKKGTPSAYPTLEQLRAEDEEEAPAIILTVADPAGSVVRRLTGPAKSGIQRVAWDLRYPAPTLGQARPVDDEEGGAGPSGSLVMPGEYNVSIAKRVDGVITQLAGPVGFKVVIEGSNQMNPSDRAALVEFQQKVSRLQRAVTGASSLANDLKTRLTQIKRAIQETPAAVENLRNDAQALDGRLNDILRSLRGDNTARARNDNTPPSISQRVGDIVDNQRMSTAKPTQTDVAQYKIAGDDFSTELQKLRMLVSTDLPRLEQALERAGAPWTPGRLPEWKEN